LPYRTIKISVTRFLDAIFFLSHYVMMRDNEKGGEEDTSSYDLHIAGYFWLNLQGITFT